MAAQQFTLEYAPRPGEQVKKDIVISSPLADPTPNQIWVGFGATVKPRRGTEILGTIEFLIAGIRDRSLIDRPAPDFKNANIVTAVDIDKRSTSNRRTSADIATSTVGDNDVAVGMGYAATEFGYKVFHEAAFEQLRRAVQEWLYKNG